MTATGFAFVSRRCSATRVAARADRRARLSDLWVFFVPLVLTYLTGGRLRTRADRVLVGAVVVESCVLAPLWLVFAE